MTLEGLHQSLRWGAKELSAADVTALRQAVRERADEVAASPSPRVTDKPVPGPSGDAHDFYAIGKYAWPDPEHPEGRWIRRDCHFNPDSYGETFDKARWDAVQVRIRLLAIATACLELGYATALAETITTWFVAPETRMNPHFRYAAALPGAWDGHPIGIIEGAALVDLLGWVGLARQAAPESAELARSLDGLGTWLGHYRTWLETSEFGQTELGLVANNHGTWAYAQVLAADIVSERAVDGDQVRSVFGALLDEQMGPDGGLKSELGRDDAWHYSVYGLRGFTTLAQLGEEIGAQLWELETETGASMRRGYAFLARYLSGADSWPYTRMEHAIDTSIDRYAYMAAALGAARFDEPDLQRARRSLLAHPKVPAELRLLTVG